MKMSNLLLQKIFMHSHVHLYHPHGGFWVPPLLEILVQVHAFLKEMIAIQTLLPLRFPLTFHYYYYTVNSLSDRHHFDHQCLSKKDVHPKHSFSVYSSCPFYQLVHPIEVSVKRVSTVDIFWKHTMQQCIFQLVNFLICQILRHKRQLKFLMALKLARWLRYLWLKDFHDMA